MLKRFSKIDWPIFFAMLLLTAVGIFMIFSSSVGSSDQANFISRQIVYLLVGLVVSGIVILVNYRVLINYSFWLYLAVLALLLITFVLGLETRGSTRWIDFKVFTLQASELAKPVLILFLTSFFAKRPPTNFKNIAISFLIMIVPTVLIFREPDLGSAIVLITLWVGLIYIAGIRLFHLISLGVIGVVVLPLGFSFLKTYQKNRLLTFLNPNVDPLGSGYNVVQSIIAVGSGQFLGRGFGRGTQSHLNFLPEQKTDFIFATTAEELGFVGIALILTLFSVIFLRIIKIAGRAESKEGAMLCWGAAFVLAVQLFINAGMNMGILPITGITLPFVSFGGSSLVSMMLLLALVQSVYLSSRKS